MDDGHPGHHDESEFCNFVEAFFGCSEGGSGAEEVNDGAFDKDREAHNNEESGLVDFVVGHEADEPHGDLPFPGHEEPAEGKGPIHLPDIFVGGFVEGALFLGGDGVETTEKTH